MIYFDNGATSFPKAPGMEKVLSDYILNNGSSISRGAYKNALDASRMVYETREILAEMFNFSDPEHVVFTKNITESLNVVIKGLLKTDDHVLISSMEHNAVMRPVNHMGCDKTIIHATKEGYITPSAVKEAITKDTKAMILLHASNVCGSINDIQAIGEILHEEGIYFIVDAAQTAGVVDIDMEACHIDVLCFTGHKSLLGPPGTGGFLIKPHMVDKVDSFIQGGTGSASEDETQPLHMPDKYESGTPNVLGIYGLHHSLNYIREIGTHNIHDHEMKLTAYFIEKIKEEGIRIVGSTSIENRTAVVSLDFDTIDNAMISFMLEKNYHIATRVGMHCAPSAHKSLDSFPNGTVRFSFSYFNTFEEVDACVDGLRAIIKQMCIE